MDSKRDFGHRESAAILPADQGQWASGEARCASGLRTYNLWIPASYDPGIASALVMMLHGCRQKADDLAAISGMNAVADGNNFLVVYPEQTLKSNVLRCWNWFEPRHQSRGTGEPAVLAEVARQVRKGYNIDPERIYVAGLSAGAAMAVILGATYPDIFAAVGAAAGLEFKAANGLMAALKAMKDGAQDPRRPAAAAAQSMRAGLSKVARTRMPVIVFHGRLDGTVHPANADLVIAQWALTNQLLSENKNGEPELSVEEANGNVPGGHTYQRKIYRDGNGHLLMEKWVVDGMDHAWPGSPIRADYADPRGPDASAEMWRFFIQTAAETLVAHHGLRALWDRSVAYVSGLFAAGKHARK